MGSTLNCCRVSTILARFLNDVAISSFQQHSPQMNLGKRSSSHTWNNMGIKIKITENLRRWKRAAVNWSRGAHRGIIRVAIWRGPKLCQYTRNYSGLCHTPALSRSPQFCGRTSWCALRPRRWSSAPCRACPCRRGDTRPPGPSRNRRSVHGFCFNRLNSLLESQNATARAAGFAFCAFSLSAPAGSEEDRCSAVATPTSLFSVLVAHCSHVPTNAHDYCCKPEWNTA